LGVYVEASQVGSLLFLSGMLPVVNGKLPITAQGIGETPSVHMVGLVAAGHFALAIGFGARCRNRVNSDAAFD
jgi:hypothetical protein